MTIKQLLNVGVKKLAGSKIKLPHLEAEVLLSFVLKKAREFLLIHPEFKPTAKQIFNYKSLISQRLKGRPVAYLTGEKEFFGLKFTVNNKVLIPRPETELMVEEALKLLTPNQRRTLLIDVGTGSGCIIISLVKKINYQSNKTNFKFIAIDISKTALMVAKKNAKIHRLNKRIKFIHGNLLNPLLPCFVSKIYDSIIILANLPYGWKEWLNDSSTDTKSLKYEPRTALFTGKTGLELYEKLFRQIKLLNAATISSNFLLIEFDPRQSRLIKKSIIKHLPEAKWQIKKDLSGLNRLAIISFPNIIDSLD